MKSPVPRINKIIGGDINIKLEDTSFIILSVFFNINGIVVPKNRLVAIPIKNEKTDN